MLTPTQCLCAHEEAYHMLRDMLLHSRESTFGSVTYACRTLQQSANFEDIESEHWLMPTVSVCDHHHSACKVHSARNRQLASFMTNCTLGVQVLCAGKSFHFDDTAMHGLHVTSAAATEQQQPMLRWCNKLMKHFRGKKVHEFTLAFHKQEEPLIKPSSQ